MPKASLSVSQYKLVMITKSKLNACMCVYPDVDLKVMQNCNASAS